MNGGLAEDLFRLLWLGLADRFRGPRPHGWQVNGHEGDHPTGRHDSSAATQDSRDRTTDPHGTRRDGGRSILTPITCITITAAIVAAAVKAATSEADSAGYPRLGFVHCETTPVVILIMESMDRCLSLGLRIHLDETETLAVARFLGLRLPGLCTVPNGVNHPSRSEEVAE